jgi:arabinofuranosyltransferase
MSFATLVFDKSTAVLFIQILGVGFMLAIAYVTMQIADYIIPHENYQNRTLIRVLSFLFALSYYPLAYWSLMGMETGLLTLLVLLGILSAFNYTRSKKSLPLLLVSGFFGLAYLTRNDSAIFAILVWAYIAWDTYIPTPKADRKGSRLLLTAVSLYLAFVVGELVFQYLYYGEILPNTYTLKLTGLSLLERIKNGVGFVAPFLKVTVYLLVMAILELVFDFQKRKLLLISIVLTAISYQIYVGGDPWNYWRIMSPSMPLLTLLFIVSVDAIVLAASSTQAFRVYSLRNPIIPKKYITHILVIPLTLIGLLIANGRFLREISLWITPYQEDANQANVNTAIVLSQLTTSDATVGVFWAGSIPYFTDRKSIDFLGKSDRYIAHLVPDTSGSVAWNGMNSVPGHNKYDLNYSIKTLKPTYVQGFTWGEQDLTQWAETKYVKIEYDGVILYLLKGSPSVFWNKINLP